MLAMLRADYSQILPDIAEQDGQVLGISAVAAASSCFCGLKAGRYVIRCLACKSIPDEYGRLFGPRLAGCSLICSPGEPQPSQSLYSDMAWAAEFWSTKWTMPTFLQQT